MKDEKDKSHLKLLCWAHTGTADKQRHFCFAAHFNRMCCSHQIQSSEIDVPCAAIILTSGLLVSRERLIHTGWKSNKEEKKRNLKQNTTTSFFLCLYSVCPLGAQVTIW